MLSKLLKELTTIGLVALILLAFALVYQNLSSKEPVVPPAPVIKNQDRFTIENLTKKDDPFFYFLITDKKTGKEYFYIKSPAPQMLDL